MRMIIALFVLVLTVACTQYRSVESYCGADAMYQINKLGDNGYRLYLKVGDMDPAICRVNEWRDRDINLSADVSSLEEAHKLIEQERQRYETLKPEVR